VAGGVAAIGLGAVVTAMAVQTEAASPDRLRNPITMDADAYARARVLYQQNCFQCHGIAGRGDGPVGRALNPRPADLKLHVTQHSEGQIYDYVSNGFPGSAMPAFKDTLSSDDRWRLVGFIKGFADDGPPAAQTATAELRARPGSASGSGAAAAAAAPGAAATPSPNGTPEAGGPGPPPQAAAGAAGDPPRALARPLAADPGATAAVADLGGRTATVRIQPARYQLGQTNAVQVEVAGAQPTAVRFSFTMASHQMPPDAGQANPLGNGRYEIPAAPRFDMAGDWRLDLDVDGRIATYWLTVSPSDGAITFVDA
jgi:mono/diheme cytochrome c family protein